MNHVYVSCMGVLYRLSPTKYKAYLAAFAQNGYADLELFGKCVGSVHNTTDMDATQAQERLDDLKKKKP